AEHVDLAVHAGIEVLVIAAPRILRQPFEVSALLPVRRDRLRRGLLHQRGEPLVGAGIEAVVEAIELERLHDRAHVGARGDLLRLVRAVHDARHHDRREDREDRDHDQDLDERESLVFHHFPISELSWKIGSRIAITMPSTSPPIARIIAGSKIAANAASRVAMSFCCWRAARSSAWSRRPLVSPLAMRCTITGGKAAVAPSARASGMPSRTPRAAAASASRIGTSVITPVPASSAARIGTPLPTRIESVAASRAASRWRSIRPATGARQARRCRRARGPGRETATRSATIAAAASAIQPTHVARRNVEKPINARVR